MSATKNARQELTPPCAGISSGPLIRDDRWISPTLPVACRWARQRTETARRLARSLPPPASGWMRCHAPGRSRTPNLLIRSYPGSSAVHDPRLGTPTASGSGRVICSDQPRKSGRSRVDPTGASARRSRVSNEGRHRSRTHYPATRSRPAGASRFRRSRQGGTAPTPTNSSSSRRARPPAVTRPVAGCSGVSDPRVPHVARTRVARAFTPQSVRRSPAVDVELEVVAVWLEVAVHRLRELVAVARNERRQLHLG